MTISSPVALLASLYVLIILTLLAPLIRYVSWGWEVKRKDIMDGLDERARRKYFEMFGRSAQTAPGKEMEEFEAFHKKAYGRRFYMLPALLLFGVASVAIILVLLTVLRQSASLLNPFIDLPGIAIAALCGAYLWVVHDLLLRARRLDFSPADVQWAALRFIVSVPMAYALGAIFDERLGLFIAFALGAFPLSALLALTRRIAERKFELGATQDESRDDIDELQGINRSVVERLRNEDITTVNQLAYCDPVRLVMRSNLSFNFVTDCMNQAIAWTYFEAKLAALRSLGLRGAVEIRNFVQAYDYVGGDADMLRGQKSAAAALPAVAGALAQSPDSVLIALREIANDPFTVFLHETWT